MFIHKTVCRTCTAESELLIKRAIAGFDIELNQLYHEGWEDDGNTSIMNGTEDNISILIITKPLKKRYD